MSTDKPVSISLSHKIDSQTIALKRNAHLEAIPQASEDEHTETEVIQSPQLQSPQLQSPQLQSPQLQSPQLQSKGFAPINTPLPKNNTMQRALEAFFDQQEVPQTAIDQLQLSSNSLSLQRQTLIDQIVNAPRNSLEQNQLIKDLKNKFGLGADIRILYLALEHDTEGIVLEAFKNMESLVPLLNEQTKTKIKAKIKQIEIRTFQPKILDAVQKLSQLLK
jgi:hypothetical protein